MPHSDLDLNAVRVFVAVADSGSFRAAARTLGVPKSTVSRKLAELEAHLGTRLVQRTTRQVALTEAGAVFHRDAAPAVAALEQSQRAMGQLATTPRGLLRVTGPLDFGHLVLADLCTEFLVQWPEVRLDLELTDRIVDLVGEGFDVAIRAGRLMDSSLMARELLATHIGLYATPEYLAARGTPQHPSELDGHDAVLFAPRPEMRLWHFRGGAGSETVAVRPVPRVVVNNFICARDFTVRGLGIGRMPEFLARCALDTGRLVPLLESWAPPEAPLHAVYASSRHLSPTIRAFLDLVVARLGKGRTSPAGPTGAVA